MNKTPEEVMEKLMRVHCPSNLMGHTLLTHGYLVVEYNNEKIEWTEINNPYIWQAPEGNE